MVKTPFVIYGEDIILYPLENGNVLKKAIPIIP
jgi:hypothetical protein